MKIQFSRWILGRDDDNRPCKHRAEFIELKTDLITDDPGALAEWVQEAINQYYGETNEITVDEIMP